MRRILGLDASSKTVGVGIIDYDATTAKLIHHEYFKPPKNKDIFVTLAATRDYIYQKIQQYQPDDIVLEDIVLFMQGKSTAATISKLAILNRTVGLAVYNFTGKSPILMNVLKIRHALKLGKKLPTKEEMPELVAKHLGIDYPWLYKVNRRTKKQQIMEESYDVADAISVAYSYILLDRKAKSKPTRKKDKK